MPTVPGVRPRLLTSFITLGVVAGLAACGGAAQPAANGPGEPAGTGVAAAPVTAQGASGVPNLDWGASAEAVMALYPRGTANETGIVAIGMTDGHQSLTQFTMGVAGLSQVEIEWVEGYVSMEHCLEGWAEVRAKVDERLGASTSGNRAAYWELPTATVTLACSPNDIGAGVLSQTYAPRRAE